MIKILMIAVFSPESTNNSQADGFRRNNCQVIEYNYRQRAEKIGNLQRDKEIVDICKLEKPDYIFYSKCNQVDISVIVECNKICKSILWYQDPPDNIDYELFAKAEFCTYCFCSLSDPYDTLKKFRKNKPTFFIEEGFDHLVNIPTIDMEKIYDVSFIGSLRGSRADYHNALKFKVFDKAYGKEHARAVGQTRINLNLTQGNGGTSDRIYKLLASGGFVLSEPWPRMEESFTPGEDFIVFEGIKDLKDKIETYLTCPLTRNKIAMQGMQSVQKFSRIHWARRVLETING